MTKFLWLLLDIFCFAFQVLIYLFLMILFLIFLGFMYGAYIYSPKYDDNQAISTTKPINYTIPNNAYWFGNTISDPRVWIYGTAGFEIANDIFNKSMPPETNFGKIYYIYDNLDNFNFIIKGK
ncbi:hypothetical protein [Campylobacter ureolyticus]|uniref:hypothetical protein n=1 Tax=Campylobacter ureolyticus TaxID=827 RepID=UPI0022B2C84B|nr:hypothetical protein [Campylobacter ureolyticus]MCZ6104422.1 hypothetical protein [Campylobacter ureolyticus]